MMTRVLLVFCLLFVGVFGDANPTCNCVAFRLDDIQDYFCSKAQVAILEVFNNTKTPITIGIIANRFGNDQSITNAVIAAAKDPTWEVEIASHGVNHEDFSTFDLETQTYLLHQSRYLIDFFTGVLPVTFIPPFNAWDINTTAAMMTNSLTHLSAQTDTDPGPFPLTNGSPYHFPIGSSTADLNNEDTAFVGKTAEQTFAEVLVQLNTSGYAAIMMHGQEFTNQNTTNRNASSYYPDQSVNETQINELYKLIQMVKEAGFTILPVGRINLDSSPTLRFGGVTNGYASPVTCNCVAFRFDAVQDYYLSAAQQAVIEAFGSVGAPITLAVIAQYFGQDPNLLNTYKSKIGNFANGVELATSGLVGADYLFLPTASQMGDLSTAVKLIKQNFGATVKTFTPLFGDFVVPDIYNVATENGIKYFSSVDRADRPPYNISSPPLWHLSSSAFTSNPFALNVSLPPVGYSAGIIFSQIKAQLQRDGFAVVSMTPLEFAAWNGNSYENGVANTTMVQTILEVLNMVKSAGIHISTISDIPRYVATNGSAIYGVKNDGVSLSFNLLGLFISLLVCLFVN